MQTTQPTNARWPSAHPAWATLIKTARAGGVAIELSRWLRFRRSQTTDPILRLKLLAAALLAPGPISGDELESRFASEHVGIDRARRAVRSIGGVYSAGRWDFRKTDKACP